MGENMFLGCFARDELPESVPRPSCLIANTDLAGDGGKHWVAFYFTDDDKGEFFCSYGSPPFEYEEFYRLLNTTEDFVWCGVTVDYKGTKATAAANIAFTIWSIAIMGVVMTKLWRISLMI